VLTSGEGDGASWTAIAAEGAVATMRILVTGGAGFIGSHYVRTLLAGGYPGFEQAEVTVLDKLTSRVTWPTSSRSKQVRGCVSSAVTSATRPCSEPLKKAQAGHPPQAGTGQPGRAQPGRAQPGRAQPERAQPERAQPERAE
jgi:hypothetical protein